MNQITNLDDSQIDTDEYKNKKTIVVEELIQLYGKYSRYDINQDSKLPDHLQAMLIGLVELKMDAKSFIGLGEDFNKFKLAVEQCIGEVISDPCLLKYISPKRLKHLKKWLISQVLDSEN